MAKSHYQIMYIFPAGVASGATRAALTQHFALQNNAADISAKVHILRFRMDLDMSNSGVSVISYISFLTGRKPRDSCNDDWDGFWNASCTHHYGTFPIDLDLFFVPHNIPYVWLVLFLFLSEYFVFLLYCCDHVDFKCRFICAFCCLLAANYRAVCCLSLTTLNCQRSAIILLHFMETGQG